LPLTDDLLPLTGDAGATVVYVAQSLALVAAASRKIQREAPPERQPDLLATRKTARARGR
jgi:hypothetical protein